MRQNIDRYFPLNKRKGEQLFRECLAETGKAPAFCLEFLGSLEEPEAIFVVVDGVRVAQRQESRWVPLISGVEVSESRRGIKVEFTDTAIH